ncbi:zinc-dependent alcohol dehydrogenase [Lysinibacter cavernae]|uniref:L-iditol 2-dehydrogenase n=1 Tax=Lysinibacter cavernae TaxID=1640652 RepID=A0A7X5QYE3_9MICO|nr:alcohol dehydrogenase catalytic domain-containing protein [Lysinibacter cavernae]NIH52275.1 L-iditol 2-dehydrogenase [Lysinibacter cavernae]
MIASSTMLAVLKTRVGEDSVELAEVPLPTPGAGEALLRVVATGICGTDVHIAHDEYPCEPPVVMGHEILGEVVAVGTESDRHWLGARVACETYYATCERCDWCRDGRRNLCPNRRSLGSFVNGGFASQVVMPVLNLHRVPDSAGLLGGVLAEPLACVTQCLLNPAAVQAGDRVLVTGPGAMGQVAAQVARALGGQVTLAGLPKDAERLAVAEGLGMLTTTERPDDSAFDVVIECSGSAPGAANALRAARRGGRYVQVGIFGNEVTLPFDLVLYKELTVSSGFASTAESWRAAMALLQQGLVNLEPLVTAQIPLAEFSEAFAMAMRGDGLKTVVVPG